MSNKLEKLSEELSLKFITQDGVSGFGISNPNKIIAYVRDEKKEREFKKYFEKLVEHIPDLSDVVFDIVVTGEIKLL